MMRTLPRRIICATLTLASAVLILGMSLTSAVAASREPVSFSMVVGSPQVVVQERGPNHAVIEWTFGLTEFSDYTGPDGRFAVNPNLRMTWNWNPDTGRGHVSGTLSTFHHFDPVQWEGELRGRVTDAGSEGTLQMTEIHTGMKLRATWSVPPLDPFGDLVTMNFVFEAIGEVSE